MIIELRSISKSPELSKSPRANKVSTTSINNSNSIRWNSGDLGFFNLIYNEKSTSTSAILEHVDKEIYFRDIYLFVK